MCLLKKSLGKLTVLSVCFLLSQCGSIPGPGPTSEQVARRAKGFEIREFQASDGRNLAYVIHRPILLNPRRAAFVYLHGIESHSGWFDLAAENLADRGYPVFSIDRRGSGLNRENRGFVSGHVDDMDQLLEDVHRAIEIAKASGDFEEIYLIGLSWGGKYVMAYDAVHPGAVDGMVLITPGMKPLVDLSIGQKLGIAVDSVFAPTRQHPTPIRSEMFTNDPEQLDYIKNDPLKLHTASAAFFMQSIRMDRLVAKDNDAKHPPMLVFLAGNDRIIDNEATREFVTRDPYGSVEIIDYPDQTHSIQLDAPGRMTSDIIRWIDSLPKRNR